MGKVSNHSFVYDASLELEDGAGAITSTAVASTAYLDLGTGQWSGYLVLDVSAIDVANGDESYILHLQGATANGFGTRVNLGSVLLGDTSVTGESADTAAGLVYFPVHNVKGDAAYQFVRLNVLVGGTSPSITFKAFLTSRV